jgi:tetratricopeptide (TPR) repeat protein
MIESIYETLSDADRALARSTLFKTELDIPMPRQTAARRDAELWGSVDLMQDEFAQRLSRARDNVFQSRRGLANTLIGLGTIADAKGDYELARRYFQEALDVFRAHGMRMDEAYCLSTLGDFALKQGDHNQAERLFAAALALYRQLGVQSSGAQYASDGVDSIQPKPLGERHIP